MRQTEVRVNLDRERVLRDDMYAEMRFEEARGKKVSEMAWDSSTDIVFRIWSMLVWEDEELSPEAVGRMLNKETIDDVLAGITSMLVGADEGPFDETGSSDGVSPDTTSA